MSDESSTQSKSPKMSKLDDDELDDSSQIKNSSRRDSESKSINSNNSNNSNNGTDLATCLCFSVFYLKFN